MKQSKMGRFIAGMVAALALCVGVRPSTAEAFGGSGTIAGRWAGHAIPNAIVDLNDDGIPGRSFTVNIYQNVLFRSGEGVLDVALVAPPGGSTFCTDPAAFELEAFGTIIWRGWGDNALYAVIDNSVHLCFNPATPEEHLVFNIVGGHGVFAGKTGSGSAVLNDVVLSTSSDGATLYLVDTHGDFEINLN